MCESFVTFNGSEIPIKIEEISQKFGKLCKRFLTSVMKIHNLQISGPGMLGGSNEGSSLKLMEFFVDQLYGNFCGILVIAGNDKKLISKSWEFFSRGCHSNTIRNLCTRETNYTV
jgi:hypothetical protein